MGPPGRSHTGARELEQLVTQPPGQAIQPSGQAGAESPSETTSEDTWPSTQLCEHPLRSVAGGPPSKPQNMLGQPFGQTISPTSPQCISGTSRKTRGGVQAASQQAWKAAASKRRIPLVAPPPGHRRSGRWSTIMQLLQEAAAAGRHAAVLPTAGSCVTSLEWLACSRPRGAT